MRVTIDLYKAALAFAAAAAVSTGWAAGPAGPEAEEMKKREVFMKVPG